MWHSDSQVIAMPANVVVESNGERRVTDEELSKLLADGNRLVVHHDLGEIERRPIVRMPV